MALVTEQPPIDQPATEQPGRLERLLLGVAVAGIVGLGVLVTLTVLSRAFRVVLLHDAVLMVQELMVAVIVLPLAYITATRSHIVVDVLSRRLPAPVQPLLPPLAVLVGLGFFGPLSWAALGDLARAWQGATYYEGDLALPEWPGRLIYALGLVMVLWRLLLQLLTDVRRLLGHCRPSSPAA